VLGHSPAHPSHRQRSRHVARAVTDSIRWDVNNATKEPQFAKPNSAFNTTNPANFGTFNGTRGSFPDIGTERLHHIFVGRLEF
jgi:hypothetical protein